MNFSQIKWILYLLVGGYLLYSFFAGGSSDDQEYVTEEIAIPTEGLITTVTEVDSSVFKIKDETAVPTVEESRIIAEYMDGAIDTFTLEEAQLYAVNQEEGSRYRGSSIMRAASYGLFGYMMGRSMSSRPAANAYVDQNTYNRVTNNTGSRIQSTARRTTTSKPSGRSGYGGSRSTRSYGG